MLKRPDVSPKSRSVALDVRGGPTDLREERFSGNVIVIEFPDRDSATGWYESPADEQILVNKRESLLRNAPHMWGGLRSEVAAIPLPCDG